MQCFCCGTEMTNGRKAKVRRNVEILRCDTWAAFESYKEQTTYRWCVVCESCYRMLDSYYGVAVINGQHFGMSGSSRGEKARKMTEEQYRTWQQRLEEQLFGASRGSK
jgi:hypothetical protein